MTPHPPSRSQQTQMHFMSHDQVAPQFTNPWVSQQQMNDAANLHALSKSPAIRSTGISSPYMSGRDMRHITSQPGHFQNSTGLMSTINSMGYPAFTGVDMSMNCSTAPSPTTSAGTFIPSFSTSFDITPPRSQIPSDRRLSQPAMHSSSLFMSAEMASKPRQASLSDTSYRSSMGSEMDFTNGSILMSQPSRSRHHHMSRHDGSTSSCPSNHSASSSVSSTHSLPYYNRGSIDSSITDYSDTTGYPQERASAARLSRTSGYLTGGASVPNQMMTTFSSKISSSTQKKHKCKVCDKRFTRPSSLQTHTYSHTGEKPFACDRDGCGRRFSVVSNLRRHSKVHQGKRDE